MTDRLDSKRRRMLAASISAAVLATGSPALAALRATPRQTRGPFYPERFPLDSDNDLVRVKGRSGRARGEITYLSGRVLGIDGRPVGGARVEIWQCDAGGIYHHPGDAGRGRPDPDFQGYGRTTSGADGTYRFRTIKPVSYPGRTPHIHIAVRAAGYDELATQMYVAGHPGNGRDWLYRRAGGDKAPISAVFEPAPELEPKALKARFDLVLAAG